MNNNKTLKEFEIYCLKFGLRGINNYDKHFKKLHKKYGGDFELIMQAADRRGDDPYSDDFDIYEFKNKNLKMSLDLMNAFTRNLNSALFNKYDLIDNISPKNILDLGSDNGFLTCFISSLFNSARVVGIEKSNNGYKISNEIKKRLEQKNCEFLNQDFFHFRNGEKYDLIFSTTFLKELSKFQIIDHTKTIKDLSSRENFYRNKDLQIASEKIFEHLDEKGIVICIERLGTFEDLFHFIRNVEESGLKCNTKVSSFLTFNTMNGEERVPLLIFRKSSKSNDKSEFNDIFRFYFQEMDFHTKELFGDSTYEQAIFESINPKNLVSRLKAIYHNESGTEFLEYWQTDLLTFCINKSNMGYFSMRISPLLTSDEIKQQNDDYISHKEDYCDISNEKVY